jgi:hypothetical protein
MLPAASVQHRRLLSHRRWTVFAAEGIILFYLKEFHFLLSRSKYS